MEFFAEDLGRVAILRVTDKGAEFKGVVPQSVDNTEMAIVGNARIVVCHGESQELMKMGENAWILVLDSPCSEAYMKAINPYVTIIHGGLLNNGNEVETYEKYSRGWNIMEEDGTLTHKKVLVVGSDNTIEVLFGESRENPIGILSIKCLKK